MLRVYEQTDYKHDVTKAHIVSDQSFLYYYFLVRSAHSCV